MSAASDPAAPRGLELWLRSPARLALLVATAVVLAAVASSFGAFELRQARGRGPDAERVLLLQLLHWGAWGALSVPIVLLGVAIGRLVRPWPLALLPHVPLSIGVGAASLLLYLALSDAVIENTWWRGSRARASQSDRDRSPENGAASRDGERSELERDRDRDGGRRDRRDRRRSRTIWDAFEWSWPYRLPREVLLYWAVLGVGLGARAYLDGRERAAEAQRLELREAALEGELARAQLSALQAQVHPHFLFNALHAVGGLVRTGDRDAAVGALDAVGALLRRGLDHADAELATLGDELDLVRRYVEVERLRLGDKLRVEFDVAPELERCEIPPLSVQPLVENAVQYGVRAQKEGGRVVVRARVEDAALVVEVDDDGPGFPPSVREGRDLGVGLGNVRARLSALFDDAARLELEESPTGGARARLVLPRDEDWNGDEAR